MPEREDADRLRGDDDDPAWTDVSDTEDEDEDDYPFAFSRVHNTEDEANVSDNFSRLQLDVHPVPGGAPTSFSSQATDNHQQISQEVMMLRQEAADSSIQREVLLGTRMTYPENVIDIFKDVPQKWLNDLAAVALQEPVRSSFMDYCKQVPSPILSIIGAPGTGKTQVVAYIINGLNKGKKVVAAAAASNVAATNLCDRVHKVMRLHPDDFLVVRPYSSWAELKRCVGFLSNGHTWEDWLNNPVYSSAKADNSMEVSAWAPSYSLCEMVLKLYGILPCTDNDAKLKQITHPTCGHASQHGYQVPTWSDRKG